MSMLRTVLAGSAESCCNDLLVCSIKVLQEVCLTEPQPLSPDGCRMIFAFARDGGLPFSAYFAKVSASTKTPRRAVWLAVLIALVMGAPMASSDAAFYGAFPLLYMACPAVPLLRLPMAASCNELTL